MRSYHLWPDKDIQFLRDNINTLSNYKIERALGITYGAVVGAMKRYNIHRCPMFLSELRGRETPQGENHHNWKGGAVYNAESQAEYRKNNPEKLHGKAVIYWLIRSGKIKRQPCEVCGTLENVDAHHDDYSKPQEVRWLCRAHHIAHHRNCRDEEVRMAKMRNDAVLEVN